MRILITNDDGINSVGIKTIADALSKEHEVYVIAPSTQRSATGHGITLHNPVTYTRLSSEKYKLRISVDGTPADCVKLAVLYFMKDGLPDLVISGINEGSNLGSEVIYSGTVSAALEGAYLRIPSIAISNADRNFAEGYELASALLCENLERFLAINLPPYTALNINYPPQKAKGLKATEIAINRYTDSYEKVGENGLLIGGLPDLEGMSENTDVKALEKGYATVSVVTLNKNDYKYMEILKGSI